MHPYYYIFFIYYASILLYYITNFKATKTLFKKQQTFQRLSKKKRKETRITYINSTSSFIDRWISNVSCNRSKIERVHQRAKCFISHRFDNEKTRMYEEMIFHIIFKNER